MKSDRVALITGASGGIGRACAAHLHARDWRVWGTSRSPAGDAPWPMIPMDVNDDESVRRGVAAVLAQYERIDLVVNNAGFGLAGAVEDTTIDEAKAQFETNMWGVWRVCRTVLPVMRAQKSGTIVNISSVAGLMGWPYHAAYTASKYAVEGFTETLRMEVAPWGINVVLIEPGDFKTEFTGNRRFTALSRANSPYRASFERVLKRMERDEQHGASPHLIGVLLEQIANEPHPRVRYRVGPRGEMLAVTLKRWLPERWFERGVRWYYGMA